MVLPIKIHVQSLIKRTNSWKITLLYQWPSIVGSLNDKVIIEKIDDDVVTLGVSHSCWMQELYLFSPLLLKTINEKLDLPRIKHIRFKQVVKKNKRKKQKNTTSITHKRTELTHNDELALIKITNPALRDVLKLFRIRCYQQ